MDDFLKNAETLNVGNIITKAVLNGVFFAVSMSWDRAISATVGLLFEHPDSVAAKFSQAFVLTSIISLGIFIFTKVFKKEHNSQPTTVVARIGAQRPRRT